MQKRSPIKVVIATLVIRKAIGRSPLAPLLGGFLEGGQDGFGRIINAEIDAYNKRHPDEKPLPRFPVSKRENNSSTEAKAVKVKIDTKEDVDAIIEHMSEILDKFQFFSMSDLRDFIGFDTTMFYHDKGWTSLVGIEIDCVEDGWTIRFPTPSYP